MHELSLVHALFDQVDRALVAHPGGNLRQICVQIGTLAGVEFELFHTAFEAAKHERGHPNVELEIEVEDTAYECSECGAAVARGGPFSCAECRGSARLARGGDLVLKRMELEVRDV